MSGPKALVWSIGVAGVGALLWCAKGIVTSGLPAAVAVAAWLLWVIAALALLTLVAYLRELALHRHAVRAGGSWRPVTALLLLWVGGLTALVSLPLVLPAGTPATTAEGTTATSPAAP